MKNLVRIFCVVLAVSFCAIAFTACGGGERVYVIGGTGPLSGDNSAYGLAVMRGATIAIDEINRDGGLNGVQFKLDMKHDACDAEQAASAYLTLIESGMQVSIGSVTSGAAKSFADAAAEDNVLCLTPSASADDVIGAGAHSFRVCFGDPQQGTIAADELVTNGGYTKIGVIYDTSDTYSTGLYNAFVARMTELGKTAGTDYVVQSFDSSNKSNFTAQVSALKNANCDVLFLPIYYGEAGLIARQATQADFKVPILGCDGLDGVKDHLEGVDASVVVRYITPFDASSTDARIKNFVTEYQNRYNETPNQFAADGYDAVMIIFKAMQAAGINDVTITASELCEALKPILTGGEFKYTGLTGADMTWTEGGSCNKAANIVTVAH